MGKTSMAPPSALPIKRKARLGTITLHPAEDIRKHLVLSSQEKPSQENMDFPCAKLNFAGSQESKQKCHPGSISFEGRKRSFGSDLTNNGNLLQRTGSMEEGIEPILSQEMPGYSQGQQYSQLDDFCTPVESAPYALDRPATPSPRKRQRSCFDTVHTDLKVGLDSQMTDICSMDPVEDSQAEGPVHFPLVEKVDAFGPLTNPYLDVSASQQSQTKKNKRKRKSLPGLQGKKHLLTRYGQDFDEVQTLGQGSFGRVVKANSRTDGGDYAIKITKKPTRTTHERREALNEVFALTSLGQHSNIIRYHTSWLEADEYGDGTLYIQFEMCDGGGLDKRIGSAVPEDELKVIVKDIASAIDHVHTNGLAHLDVKPENILINKGCHKLADFGLATSAKNKYRGEPTEGDSRYLSREAMEGDFSNMNAIDVFALGATIYELALGQPLSQGGPRWHSLRDGDMTVPNVSKTLFDLIQNMLNPNPTMRPSAREILKHPAIMDEPQRKIFELQQQIEHLEKTLIEKN